MTPEQQVQFFNDGFLVFRDIVPREAVLQAVQTMYGQLARVWRTSSTLARQQDRASKRDEREWQEANHHAMRFGVHPAILNLVQSDGELYTNICEAIGGPIGELRGAQIASLFPSNLTNHVTECGYPNLDIPFYGWHGHLDGIWNGSTTVHQDLTRPMNEAEYAAWSQETGRNGVRKTYPKYKANISNFTALLGVALSDQMIEGSGNLGLLKGAHHEVEKFFRYQRKLGGPLGPDGPGWERLDIEAPNRSGLRHYPERVREAFAADAARTTDGRLWPKPTLIKVQPGDAILALHAIPHCATRLERFTPRVIAYFRIFAGSRNSENSLVYSDALCDCWKEWQGMQEVVQDLRDPRSE